MEHLGSEIPLTYVTRNIAVMLRANALRFAGHTAFLQKDASGQFAATTWQQLYADVCHIAHNLSKHGITRGDKVVLFSPNCLAMLEVELAIMASGAVAVPIFAYFKQETADLLIGHSEAKFLVAHGSHQLSNVGTHHGLSRIFTLTDTEDHRHPHTVPFRELVRSVNGSEATLDFGMEPRDICLGMYTSGTMGTPKCVQLMHVNILSQQAALSQLWDIGSDDRFLSYLPWHHSFGGIFELFAALCNGAPYALEDSAGKDPSSIIANWALVRPTVFFSVPKVYQTLVDLAHTSPEAEERFFGSGLKFIFTAAASLPLRLSEEFEGRGIRVMEGWGLTETSPCCTVTDPGHRREPGVVGLPIPGVELRLAPDGEIQVKGPNVMDSYFHNDEANAGAFTPDGWFCTGDVGEFRPNGLKLVARKDRIFKLSNGEKVVPTDLEQQIEKHCHYIQYAIVAGSGEEYPVALLFPNRKLLSNPDYEMTPEEGCFCPRTYTELARCLRGCLHDANCNILQKFAKVKRAAILDAELSLDDQTLTPSMKMAPRKVVETYRHQLRTLYGDQVPLNEEIYIIELETTQATRGLR